MNDHFALHCFGSYYYTARARSCFKSTVNYFCAFVCDFDTFYSLFSCAASTENYLYCVAFP